MSYTKEGNLTWCCTTFITLLQLLSGTILLLHDCNCASYRSAASENPWARAFKEFYDSVASEYSRPSGKNRIHKFKAKMVELWKAMEMELESGDKSRSDPIYSMALRQYRRYNSVLSNPELESNRPFPSTDPSNSRTANTEPPPPQPELTEMDRMRKSLLRLERMMTQNGWAQPKLPSPLNELQHLKEQMTQQQFDTSVRPTYEREIGKYLTGVHTQARFSNSPAYLPGVLDGIDVLRYTPQPSAVAWTLKSTYDYVLNKYMKLLNGTDTSEARKRKRGDGSVEDITINSEARATEDAGGETKQSDYV